MEEAKSDVESMPDDEIVSIYEEDNDEDDSDRELFVTDEVVADNIIDELIIKANKKDTNIFATTTNEVSYEFVHQSDSTSSLANIQALTAKAEIQITKALGSDLLSYLPRRLDFLIAQVDNVAKNLPTQLVSIIDRIISEALAQQFPNLLTATIKNTLPCALTNQPEPTTAYDTQSTNVPTPAQREPQATDTLVSQNSTALVVHSATKEPPSKRLKVVIEIPNIPTLVPLNSINPITVDNILFDQSTTNLFSSSESQYSPTPLLRMADKGKGIAKTFDDDIIKQVMSFMKEGGSEAKRLADLKVKREKLEKKLRTLTPVQLRAQEEELAKIEAKRTQHMNKMRDGYDYCINFKDDPLPITKFNYREKILVDGMQRNLVHPVGVVGSAMLVIREP
nr:hypothetical protein [Tanacetum cinerariifolium]